MTLIIKQLFIFIIGVTIVMSTGYIIGGDRYLPWVKKEVVYVVLNTDEAVEVENGRTIYKSVGVNASGEQSSVIFEIVNEIPAGTILKLHSKGNYTSSLEIIETSDLPQKIRTNFF